MQPQESNLEIAFTGERVVPGKTPPFLVLEHLVRYHFAAQFAAGRRILDIGCGTGYGAAVLAKNAALVVAADCAPAAVRYALKNYRHGSLCYALADCRSLPFRERSFDLAIMFEVIEHIAEQEQCLSEIRRILVPGGLLILSTPNSARPTKVIEEPNPFHYKELPEEEFLGLLRSNFDHVQLHYQYEFSAVSIQAAESRAQRQFRTVEELSVPEPAKYFVAVCGSRPPQRFASRVLGLGGIEHQIAIVQDLRQLQGERTAYQQGIDALRTEVDTLLRQRVEYQQEIDALLRQRVEYQQEIDALLRQRVEYQRLESELRKEIEVRDRRLEELDRQNAAHATELEWLYRWIPLNRLARNLLYGKNLRRRLMARFHFKL